MFIRDNEFIPQEVENFLLEYETTLKLDKEMHDEIELSKISHFDIFEGVIRYWKKGRIVMQIVIWHSGCDEPPKVYKLTQIKS